ncbi:tyrosine-protein phosphatase non-receptor type substrate 1-like [Dendropsophus ebraccatus]|uniref:tyrosine-protein phosphatase non-receptor type substrate 1-like n=1 Tax=Dendropsophus ebraccatus TaxID=150705 RepID=UPI0038313713
MEMLSMLRLLVILHLIFSGTSVNRQKHLVVTQPEMVQAEAGESVTINCSFTSKSPSYSARWTIGCNHTVSLQDHPCFQHRVKLTSLDPNQTSHGQESNSTQETAITITNVTENDSGRICCHIRTTDRETGTGVGTRLVITARSSAAESNNKESDNRVPLLVEITRITCLFILIILLAIAVKTSC